MRLDKALQSQGFGTRKECRLLVNTGRVLVNGVSAASPDDELDTEGLVLTVSGLEWAFAEQVYLALNKPADLECSHTPTHHPSVFSLLPAHLIARGVQCVGRLDADTTGLLLLSDDGTFIQKMTSPKHKVPKRYVVTCAEPVTESQVESLRAGVVLNDAPEPVCAEAERAGERLLHLTIAEGKYHQAKRMVAAAGNHVVSLHRDRVGALELPSTLAPREWMRIDPASVQSIAP